MARSSPPAAIIDLQSGAILSGVTVLDGGIEKIDAGFTLTVLSGGTSGHAQVLSSGLELVRSGGTASGTIVSNGGTLWVSSGGTDVSATIQSGGTLIVGTNGVGTGATVSSGARIELLSGATVGGAVLQSGYILAFGPGYVASNYVVSSGAFVQILSGSVVSGLSIASGGTLELGSGMVYSGTVTQGATVELLSSATVSGADVKSGGTLELLYGAIYSGATVEAGGHFGGRGQRHVIDQLRPDGERRDRAERRPPGRLFGRHGERDDRLLGGTLELLSGASNVSATFQSGGILEVASGYVYSGIVSSGIVLEVTSGGIASGVEIQSGSALELYNQNLYPSNSASVSNITLDSGATLIFNGNGYGSPYFSGSTGSNAVLSGYSYGAVFTTSNGITVDIQYSGVQNGNTILSGGTVDVEASGALQAAGSRGIIIARRLLPQASIRMAVSTSTAAR